MFDKTLSKDNRMTVLLMGIACTVIYETILYLMQYIVYGINLEILSFIKTLLVEVIYNILITIIIYPLIQKFGYYIENEYKRNRILTRYF